MNKLLLLLTLLLLISCNKSNLDNSTSEINEQIICNKNADCACGANTITGQCFFGNKKFVNTEKQCPDFCSGLTGNLTLLCQNNQCIQQTLFSKTPTVTTTTDDNTVMCTMIYKPVC